MSSYAARNFAWTSAVVGKLSATSASTDHGVVHVALQDRGDGHRQDACGLRAELRAAGAATARRAARAEIDRAHTDDGDLLHLLGSRSGSRAPARRCTPYRIERIEDRELQI